MDLDKDKMAEIINNIRKCDDIPIDLNRSIFIALPKISSENEYKLQWTLSYIKKCFTQILMNRE